MVHLIFRKTKLGESWNLKGQWAHLDCCVIFEETFYTQKTTASLVPHIYFLFLEQFRVHSKTGWKVKIFPIHHLPQLTRGVPRCQNPAPGRYIHFSKGQPTLTHRYHPKSIVYTGICSWGCTFHGSWRMNSDMYPPWYSFPGLEVLCSAQSSVLLPDLWYPLIFLLSPQFSLFQCRRAGII